MLAFHNCTGLLVVTIKELCSRNGGFDRRIIEAVTRRTIEEYANG
jgi:hypothetical protein